jgi:uncharacterized hydrophobic protein (TIGR00341 family)
VRLVQVTIPAGKREAVLGTLDEEGIDYVVHDETSGREYTAVVSFPLPTNAVEPVLDQLHAVGIDETAYTIVLEASTVISERFDAFAEEYAEAEAPERIAREELTSKARDLAPSLTTFVIMSIISAVIATAGLLLDSPAVVVGSMVIAPLIGPAMAASVGTLVDDSELFRRGVKLQALGLALSILSAAVFAFLVRQVHLVPPIADITTVPEIRERIAPDFLSLAVALGAGVAGVVSLTSGVSTALVGVMIAVALIPPAAVVGIGAAWGAPFVSLGSGVLLLVNVLSINLAALAVLWYQGYSPRTWFRSEEARSATLKRIGALAVAILVLSVFLVGVTYDSYQQAQTEKRIQEGAAVIVAGTNAELLEVEVQQTGTTVFSRPSRVIIRIGIAPGTEPPEVAPELGAMVDGVADRDVETRVDVVRIARG